MKQNRRRCRFGQEDDKFISGYIRFEIGGFCKVSEWKVWELMSGGVRELVSWSSDCCSLLGFTALSERIGCNDEDFLDLSSQSWIYTRLQVLRLELKRIGIRGVPR